MKAPRNGYFWSLHKWTLTKNKAKSKMKKLSKCRCQLNSSFQQSGGFAYSSITHEMSFVGERSETHYELPDEAEGYQVTGNTALQRECSVATWRPSHFNEARPCHLSLNHLRPLRPHSLKGGWYTEGPEQEDLVPSQWKFLEDRGHLEGHLPWPVFSGQTSHLRMLWR